MQHTGEYRTARLTAGAAAIVGLGHAIAPWVWGYSHVPEAVVSNVISGLALAVFGGLRALAGLRWAVWPAIACGLWMLAAPIGFQFEAGGIAANEGLWAGIPAVAFAAISAMAGFSPDREMHPTPVRHHP